MQNTKKNDMKYKYFIFLPYKIENFSSFLRRGDGIFWRKIYFSDILVIFITENAYKHHITS